MMPVIRPRLLAVVRKDVVQFPEFSKLRRHPPRDRLDRHRRLNADIGPEPLEERNCLSSGEAGVVQLSRLELLIKRLFATETLGLSLRHLAVLNQGPDALFHALPLGIVAKCLEWSLIGLLGIQSSQAQRFIGEAIVEGLASWPNVLRVELSRSEKIVEADRPAGIGVKFSAFLPQHPFLNICTRRLDTFRVQVGGGFLAAFLLSALTRLHLLALALRLADLAGDLDADQVGLAVKADQIVDDPAQFILGADDGWIAQRGDTLLLFLVGGARQPVQNFAGRLLPVRKDSCPPILPLQFQAVDQRAESNVGFEMRHKLLDSSDRKRLPSCRQLEVAQRGGLFRGYAEIGNKAFFCFGAAPPALRLRQNDDALITDLSIISCPQALMNSLSNRLHMRVVRPCLAEDFSQLRFDGIAKKFRIAAFLKIEAEAFLPAGLAPRLEYGFERGAHARPTHRRLNLQFFENGGALLVVQRARISSDER